jgi:hypothetical protein
MALDYPSKVINSPEFAQVLSRVFMYHADVYDLEAYDTIRPGFGRRIWDLIEAEKGLQQAQEKFSRAGWLERVFG